MNDYNSLFKNKGFVIWLACITLFVIGVAIYLINDNRHFKIGPAEVYSKDTVSNLKQRPDSTSRHNISKPVAQEKQTSLKVKPNTLGKIKQKNSFGDNNGVNRDNNGVIAKDARDVHIVNGPNSGINGNVYTGVKQRHIDQAVLDYIAKEIVDTSLALTVMWANDQESINYANELIEKLMTKGYSNFRQNGSFIGGTNKKGVNGVVVDRVWAASAVIMVLGASNVQN